jgi:tetratricopeptide (TPR) repeat protein
MPRASIAPARISHLSAIVGLGVLAICFSPIAAAAGCTNVRFNKAAALLVGISNPTLPEGPPPLQFAATDVDRLKPFFENAFGPANVFTLKNQDATTANVSACLDALARAAPAASKVVIFFSARGFSSRQMNDGYVLTWDAIIDKLPRVRANRTGNGISVGELRATIERMNPSVEKYLLLDLCRDPAERPNLDNLIGNRLLDRSFLDSATRLMILASAGNRRSLESATSRTGLYANALAQVLKPGLSLEEVFSGLKARIKAESQSKQEPQRPNPVRNDRWNECLLCGQGGAAPAASATALARIGVSFFFAASPQGPDQGTPAPSAADIQRIERAVAEEEHAQKTFVRYGEGNHFSGDPFHECEHTDPKFRSFRLCREEYDAAARSFELAARLRSELPPNLPEADPALIASLSERARFCRAQALLIGKDWARVPAEMGKPEKFEFAESHNVLGIAYLMQAKYAEAERQFNESIRKAPHWGYPRHNLALAYVEHGNYGAAEREYEDAIRWAPVAEKWSSDRDNPCFHGRALIVVARPYLYYNQAVLFQRVNRLAEAQQQYCLAAESFRLRLAELQPSGPDVPAEERDLAQLRSEAAKINLADVDNSLGALFESRNKKKQARHQFLKALSNNPDLLAARYNLARMDAERDRAAGDVAAARRRYQELIELPACKNRRDDLACQAAGKALNELPGAAQK